jgi:hypothetical protein
VFPIMTPYMNAFPAERQNIPCRASMPFEFIQPTAMDTNQNRPSDVGRKSRACLFAFCRRKGVGCHVSHSGNFSTKVSKKFATPIIKHCIFYSFSKLTRVMPSTALYCTSGKSDRALNPRSNCYREQQNYARVKSEP